MTEWRGLDANCTELWDLEGNTKACHVKGQKRPEGNHVIPDLVLSVSIAPDQKCVIWFRMRFHLLAHVFFAHSVSVREQAILHACVVTRNGDIYGVPSPPKIKVDHNIQLDSLTINLANINIIFHSSTFVLCITIIETLNIDFQSDSSTFNFIHQHSC